MHFKRFRDIDALKLPDTQHINCHEINFNWIKANATHLRQLNPIGAARMVIGEFRQIVQCIVHAPQTFRLVIIVSAL